MKLEAELLSEILWVSPDNDSVKRTHFSLEKWNEDYTQIFFN
jgi:hypothetical protein